MTQHRNDYWTLILIYLVVFIPNALLSNYFSGLVHDDAFQMQITNLYHNKSWFGIPFFMNALRESILSQLALYVSPIASRLLVSAIYLGGGSLLLFILLRDRFRLPVPACAFAATAPFLVPALWQIPLGINISYVAGDLFFSLVAAHFIVAFLRNELSAWAQPVVIFSIFILMAEVQPSSAITGPILLGLAATYGPTRLQRRIIILVTSASAVFTAYVSEMGAGRRTPISGEQFISNYFQFWLEAPNVMNPGLPNWFWFSLIFCLSCVFIYHSWRITSHFARKVSNAPIRTLISGGHISSGLAVALCVLAWSPIPYTITASSTVAATYDRYYFLWQIGFWAALGLSIAILPSAITRALSATTKHKLIVSSSFAPLVIGLAITGLTFNKSVNYPSALTDRQSLIQPFRIDAARQINAGDERQILLLLSPQNSRLIPHLSNPNAGLGYLNFLMPHRNFTTAAIASTNMCSSVFDELKINYGYYEISGFSEDRSMLVIYYDRPRRIVHSFEYMVDFNAPNTGRLIRLNGTPEFVATFNTREELSSILSDFEISVDTVAFAEQFLNNQCTFRDSSFQN